jgi:hypothetical protein
VRVLPTILIVLILASPILAEDLAPTHAKVAVMEKLVGTWTGPYTDAEGTAMEAKCIFAWTPTKYAILWTWTDWPKGSPDRVGGHANGMIHWDPVSKKIKEVGVLSDGTTFTTYFSVDGDRIVGDRKIADVMGQITTGKESWKVTEKEWNWAPTEIRDENGKIVRKFPEGTLTREKQ